MNTARSLISLMAFSAFALLLLGFRMAHYSNETFLFLVWNLFLAWVPVPLSLAMLKLKNKHIVYTLMLFVPWLLFFPNAAYLVTDLVHLRPRAPIPYWFDIVLLSTFALAGMFISCSTLRFVHQSFRSLIGARLSTLLCVFVSFAAGYAIYLGRFLRWNSWDVVSDFKSLALSMLAPLIHPSQNARAFGVTIAVGLLILLSYWIFETQARPSVEVTR